MTVGSTVPNTPIPTTPDLLAASDSCVSSTDNITNFNNLTAGGALQFSIGNTVAGNTVEVFLNGVLLGSALASGNVTTVSTTAGTKLKDGVYTVIARQLSGQYESADSPSLSITIDTVAPFPPLA